MEILEYMYKGVVKPSYKNNTREDANRASHSSNKRGEAASSKTHSATGESVCKLQKQYVDRLKR